MGLHALSSENPIYFKSSKLSFVVKIYQTWVITGILSTTIWIFS